MRGDKATVRLDGDIVKLRHGQRAAVPDGFPTPRCGLQLEHLDRLASPVIYHVKLDLSIRTFQYRDAVRNDHIAQGSGTGRVAPVFARIGGNRDLAVGLLRDIEQHQSLPRRRRGSSSTARVHKFAQNQKLPVRRKFQVLGRMRAAQNIHVTVRAAFHQRWRCGAAFRLRCRNEPERQKRCNVLYHCAGSKRINAPFSSSVSTYTSPSGPWRTSRMRCFMSVSRDCRLVSSHFSLKTIRSRWPTPWTAPPSIAPTRTLFFQSGKRSPV